MSPSVPLRVRVEELEIAMELRDLSLGGFSIACARPFAIGAEQEFLFLTPRNGLCVTLAARAVHARGETRDNKLWFVTGWEFIPGHRADQDDVIRALYSAACQT